MVPTSSIVSGRGAGIRTRDLYVPNVARYHAALLPDYRPIPAHFCCRYINLSVPNVTRYHAVLFPDALKTLLEGIPHYRVSVRLEPTKPSLCLQQEPLQV